MIQTYTFVDGGTVEFDDTRSVRELLEYAFDEFDYYEPFGMETVTLFQLHHPDTHTGWFTTDVNRSCAEEIQTHDWLCFAYHKPGVFYYAEGGKGHHMTSLGNHPALPDPVPLSLRFEDFHHTVVFNGNLTFRQILRMLTEAEYIDADCRFIRAIPIGYADQSYLIPFSDPIMDLRLVDFVVKLDEYSAARLTSVPKGALYHTDLEIC